MAKNLESNGYSYGRKHKDIDFDEFLRLSKEITNELQLQKPKYYKYIESITGLKHAEDLRTCFFIFTYFLSLIILWNWDTIINKCNLNLNENIQYWSFYCLLFVNMFLSFDGAVITHNTMHCSISRWNWANKVFQCLLSLTYGHPVSSYVPGHNLSHHKFTQTKKDVMNTHLLQYEHHFFNFLLFQPTVAAQVMKSDIRYMLYQYQKGNVYFISQCLKELLILTIVQFSLAYLNIYKFFLFFFIPHAFAQYSIVTLNMLQHDGCDIRDNSDKKVNFNTSRNFTSIFLNYLCFNNGYHTIHHFLPTSHWSFNKVLHERLVVGNTDDRLHWRSIFHFIFYAYFLNGTFNSERLDYKRNIVVIEKTDKNFYTTGEDYEEWLTASKDFNTDDLPRSRVVLLQCMAILLAKFTISPFYCFDPHLKLM